jgi:hypothetical protein
MGKVGIKVLIWTVQLLSRQPVEGVVVEATCLTCTGAALETSTTDKLGQYRVRGLQPRQQYAISVARSSDRMRIRDV